MEEYFRLGNSFEKRVMTQKLTSRDARYLFFRMACPIMQSKLPKMWDLSKTPLTFVHGNPHIDNYVKTHQGSAMVDFDRARIGPYCWDIIRFLSSLSFRREESDGFLDRRVIDYFLDAYIIHYHNPDVPSKNLRVLKNTVPEKWQRTTRDYLKGNKRWVKKMRENSLSPKSEMVQQILIKYLGSRNDLSLLDDYVLSEVGLTVGSFGKKHLIYALIPKNPDSHLDSILLDIKEVYMEKDSKYFFSPCPHHGERMILASKIYADGMEERLGFCTHLDKQYWGRQVPCFAAKVKKYLNKDEQYDFASTVGSILGKGHRKGLVDSKNPQNIEKDLLENFDKYFKLSKLFTLDLNLAFEGVMRKIKLYQDYRSW